MTESPYTPHSREDVEQMLGEVGVASVEELFDVPQELRYEGGFDVEAKSEKETVEHVSKLLEENDDVVEFVGGGHYSHYVPSVVDHLADRSEFLTSYTQYQPEVSQGFLQALFEYQSLLVELTGLEVANASVYDAASALGEAALMAARVESGSRVLVPDDLYRGRRSVLENYVEGAGLNVEGYPTERGNADVDALEELVDDDVVFVYLESPNRCGAVEERASEVGGLSDDVDAVFCVGSDPVALALLEPPAAVGADVVVGDASVLGVSAAYGMGCGFYVTREEYVRQVPGHLVGAAPDADGRRAYTLTLQTREQHIRRERATSNICTNQAWMALRAAIHASLLGPEGLVDLAERCVELPHDVASRFDEVDGVTAPAFDRYYFREFVAEVDGDAEKVAGDLLERGYVVGVDSGSRLRVCVTEVNEDEVDGLVDALEEVMG